MRLTDGNFARIPHGAAQRRRSSKDAPYFTISIGSYYRIRQKLPLKEMSEAGKIHYCSHPGFHMNFKDDWFIETVIPFLH